MGQFPQKYAHITSSLNRTQKSCIKGAIILTMWESIIFFLAYVQTHRYTQRLISKIALYNYKVTLKNQVFHNFQLSKYSIIMVKVTMLW